MTNTTPVMLLNSATTRQAFKGKCWLISATLAGNGANVDAQIYDGVDTTSDKRTHLETLSGTTSSLDLPEPILFERGIYLVCSATTANLTITFVPADREDPLRYPIAR